MTTTSSTPMISAGERIIPTADNAALMRRVDDFPLPSRPLDWDEEGTPIEGSVVYLYHPRGERFVRWAEIRTQEQLLDIQAAPDRFEIRTLFSVPVEDLARSPISLVAAARIKLDIIERATGAAIANMRAVAQQLGAKP